jgi:hypothetical protein
MSKTPSVSTFSLNELAKQCWANEHMAPALVEQSTFAIEHPQPGKMTRASYYRITCNNGKTNAYRNCGYPRGFITWDDEIGLHPDNPEHWCGRLSRQDCKELFSLCYL